jgi:hypothetical protein
MTSKKRLKLIAGIQKDYSSKKKIWETKMKIDIFRETKNIFNYYFYFDLLKF